MDEVRELPFGSVKEEGDDPTADGKKKSVNNRNIYRRRSNCDAKTYLLFKEKSLLL